MIRHRFVRLLPVLAFALSFPACQLSSSFPFKSTLEAIANREDQRVAPEEIYDYLEYEDTVVRYRAALALARLRNPQAVETIATSLDKEREVQVTEMLIFALGQIHSPEGANTLLKFFASSVDTVRAASVEAVGKLQVPSLTQPVIDILENDPSPYVRAEACVALFRMGAKRYAIEPELSPELASARTQALRRALRYDENPAVRWRAAYALAGIQDPSAGESLREALLLDDDLWVRCFAARALRALPNSEENRQALIEACMKARGTGDWNVVVEGIAALGNYDDLETAALLINFLLPGQNPNIHIRAAAARTLGRMQEGGDTIVKALVGATKDPSRTVVGEAIVAIGTWGDTFDILERTAQSEDRFIRMKTVKAASEMGADGLDLILDLATDLSIRVRCSALEALSDPAYHEYREEIIPLAEESLALGDMSLRHTAADLLRKLDAQESVRLLKTAYSASLDPEMAEARLKIVEAMAALGGPDDIEFFRFAVRDPDFEVRNEAARALAYFGELSQIEPKTIERQVRPVAGEDYMNDEINPVAHFKTKKGEFWIELFKEHAPTHVKNFIRLAESGFYNKLTFHRMVSNFVVQGLDPRGDGWGFNNIRLRDEMNRLKFLRGYVGMPNSGPDTGGCQIFITHCPTPHLDGEYTLFGRVLAGMDVVDSLEVGDLVYRVTIN